jgi:hypothetical protein
LQISLESNIKGTTAKERQILQITQAMYELTMDLKSEANKKQKRIVTLEKENDRLRSITTASEETKNQQKQKQQPQRMSDSKAARNATEYIEQLPVNKRPEAAAQLLTSGRHPANNRPVTAKPPMAQRLTAINSLTDANEILNDNFRNKILRMKWINVKGISRLPFGEIRRLFRNLSFDTAYIANIRSISNNMHEFILYDQDQADAFKEIVKNRLTNASLEDDNYKFWEANSPNMDDATATKIAIQNLARNASQHQDMAIGTAFQFRLPLALRPAYIEELAKFQDGQRKDKETPIATPLNPTQ